MANIFDYLEWRGDVPFSADPFNEVDNLVLAELSYADLKECVPGDGTKKTVAEVRDAFFTMYDREEVRNRSWFTAPAPFLLDGMSDGARFDETLMSDYINVVDSEREEQMSAVTFWLPDGTIYVAFRGTDSTVVGWKEDFNFSYMAETAGQKRSAEYLTKIGKKFKGKIRVGGHSKGGNFAVYAAAFCDSKVQDRIIEVWSNDGPGFRDEIVNSDGYQRILPRTRGILPETSMIGVLLEAGYSQQVVKSSETGITQHDGFSWQLKRNKFEEAERNDQSAYVDETISDWLSGMDDDTKMSVINTVFTLIESTGVDSFSEISNQKWNSVESIVNAMIGLPTEKRKELITQFGELLHSGGKAALARAPFNKE